MSAAAELTPEQLSDAPLLKAEGVSIEFGGLKALTDFNLAIRKGDLQGLIGPNGAGKTTAFNVLTGVYQPTRGQVRVAGNVVNGLKPHQINQQGLARTFQNIRLFRALTALDNVKVACRAEALSDTFAHGVAGNVVPSGGRGGLGARALAQVIANGRSLFLVGWWKSLLLTPGFLAEERRITEQAERLLEVMGLSHRRNEEARNLPYGEQRRLEIARALGTRPRVLLLDEPAAGMNTREKADLMVLIRKLRDEFSLGILVIEHDMKLVMGICEKITVLDHGETIARGAPEQVRTDRKVIEAYLGDNYLETHGGAA
ncbi:ABC transporter ATP-binding protein [Hyalangium versicolor]|uniref:ABC transporter ATP-binding protein n=1 Tax=Hyalangium versicolor TaxID=2861190 RepID=UPI001CCFCC29|nr:ABC transporter ATP-binding protein [Hyalangium versicolor]